MDKKERTSASTLEAPVYVPVHMKGAYEIAAVFGVHRSTVLAWKTKGAPIRLVGKKYQANYGELWPWVRDNVGT